MAAESRRSPGLRTPHCQPQRRAMSMEDSSARCEGPVPRSSRPGGSPPRTWSGRSQSPTPRYTVAPGRRSKSSRSAIRGTCWRSLVRGPRPPGSSRSSGRNSATTCLHGASGWVPFEQLTDPWTMEVRAPWDPRGRRHAVRPYVHHQDRGRALGSRRAHAARQGGTELRLRPDPGLRMNRAWRPRASLSGLTGACPSPRPTRRPWATWAIRSSGSRRRSWARSRPSSTRQAMR